MQYLVKFVRHADNTNHFCLPREVIERRNLSKSLHYLFIPSGPSTFEIFYSDTLPVPFSDDLKDSYDKFGRYPKPRKEFARPSFYVPLDFSKMLRLLGTKYLIVEDNDKPSITIRRHTNE